MDLYTLTLTFLFVSLLLIACASTQKWIATLAIAIATVSLVLCLSYFVISRFSDGGFNTAALNHLHYALDPSTLIKFWKTASLSLLGLLLIIAAAILINNRGIGVLARSTAKFGAIASLSAVFTSSLSLYFNPMLVDGVKLYQAHLYSERTKLPENFDSVNELAPSVAAIPPSKQNDFILIFAEGYESAFLDETLYPGLTPNLNALISEKGKRIRGMRDLVLTNWTQGGMSAATCGLAMLPEYSEGNQAALKSTSLIGETCTGDRLSHDGYRLSFFGGSQFGDNDKYRLYRHQGYDEVMIQDEFATIFDSSTPTTSWGYHDADVLRFVSERFIETSKTGLEEGPRGYVVLTLDSHQPGLPSPECASQPYRNGDDLILNGVHCDDRLLAQFINKILDNPATKDTTILLVSDHLHAKPPEKLRAISREMRDYLFVAFNSHPNAKFLTTIKRDSTAIDIAPTLLALLGYEVNEFNLGRNLLKPENTLVESLGRESMFANIANMRARIRDHWNEHRPKQGNDSQAHKH